MCGTHQWSRDPCTKSIPKRQHFRTNDGALDCEKQHLHLQSAILLLPLRLWYSGYYYQDELITLHQRQPRKCALCKSQLVHQQGVVSNTDVQPNHMQQDRNPRCCVPARGLGQCVFPHQQCSGRGHEPREHAERMSPPAGAAAIYRAWNEFDF